MIFISISLLVITPVVYNQRLFVHNAGVYKRAHGIFKLLYFFVKMGRGVVGEYVMPFSVHLVGCRADNTVFGVAGYKIILYFQPVRVANIISIKPSNIWRTGM